MHVNSFKRYIYQHLLDANNFMKQKITFYTRLNGKQYCYSGVQSITTTRYRKYTFTWKIECVCVNKVRESKSYCNKGTIWKEIYVFYRNNFYYITKVFECKQQLPYNKSQGLHREFNIVSGVVLKHIFQKQTETQAGGAFVRKTLTIKVNLRQVGDIICFCIILPSSSFSNGNIGCHTNYYYYANFHVQRTFNN